MRVAILIIIVTFAIALLVAVGQLVIRSIGNGDTGRSFGSGADGGVYVSLDGGATFVQGAPTGAETSFPRSDVLDLREDAEVPGTWWLATEGQGLFRSRDQGKTWEPFWGEDDVLRQTVIRGIAQFPDGTMLLALDRDGRGRIWKSDEGIARFREVFSAASEGIAVQSLALSDRGGSFVFAGLTDGLLVGSSDGGESWTSLTQFAAPVRAIAAAPSDGSVAYAAVERAGVFRTRDRGVTWEDLQRLSSGLKAEEGEEERLTSFTGSRTTYAIAVHPNNPEDLLLATAAGLLRSRDGGLRFLQLPVPLRPQRLAVRAASFHPSSSQTLFAAAEDGFYASFDGGTNWRIVRFAIAESLTSIAVSRDGNILLVGTASP